MKSATVTAHATWNKPLEPRATTKSVFESKPKESTADAGTAKPIMSESEYETDTDAESEEA